MALVKHSVKRRKLLALAAAVLYSSSGVAAYWCISQDAPGSQAVRDVVKGAAETVKRQLGGLSGLDLAIAIFLNNIKPLYHPMALSFWLLPGVGLVSIISMITANGVLLGAVVAELLPKLGALRVAASLIPHGVVELPAAILMFSAMLCWQSFVIRLLIFLIRGGERPSLLSLADATVLASASVGLFALAALLEAFVTPVVALALH